MNMETMKIDLAKQLFGVEEKAVLDEIKSTLDEKVIVAYAVDGKPLTLSQPVQRCIGKSRGRCPTRTGLQF